MDKLYISPQGHRSKYFKCCTYSPKRMYFGGVPIPHPTIIYFFDMHTRSDNCDFDRYIYRLSSKINQVTSNSSFIKIHNFYYTKIEKYSNQLLFNPFFTIIDIGHCTFLYIETNSMFSFTFPVVHKILNKT